MKLLVFGCNGQVATELRRLNGDQIESLGRDAADLTNPDACAARIAATDADAVINAAAYTAVDQAQDEVDIARAVNATAPGAMARACAARGLPFVHISTDYVFDGTGDIPFTPDHPTGPLGIYGLTKLEGEDAVRAADGTYAIFRTSWVISAHGNNFVKTMLRLGGEMDRLTIVADQIGGPTPAADIAQICAVAAHQLQANPAKSGTYHVSGGPDDVSWADFARTIFQMAAIECDVVDIPSTDYPTPTPRPLNSRLDYNTTKTTFGIARPDWRAGLVDILKELGAF